MEFIELTVDEFKEARKKFDGNSFYQTYHWTKVKKMNGWDCFMVGVKENNEIIACSIILGKKMHIDRYLYYAPRGMLLDYNNKELLEFFVKNIKQFLKERKGFKFKIDPLVEYRKHDKNGDVINEEFNNQGIVDNLKKLGFKHHGFTRGYANEVQFRWSYCLDLDKSLDDLIEEMDQRCRRCLRKAYKYPLVLEDVNDENILEFKEIMKSTAIRQKHVDRSLEYYSSLDKKLKTMSRLVIAYLDRDKYLEDFKDDSLYDLISKDDRKKIPVSAGVFVFDQERGNYVYGGTHKEYMHLMAPYMVQLEMIKYTISLGLKKYDFGGITGNFNPKSSGYGVYEFKRGFGGYVVEYIGEFDLILDKPVSILFSVSYFVYGKLKSLLHLFKKV